MATGDFRSLSRGDLVHVDGNGQAVVESAYFQASEFKVDLRLRGSDERIVGLSEEHSALVRILSPSHVLRIFEVEHA